MEDMHCDNYRISSCVIIGAQFPCFLFFLFLLFSFFFNIFSIFLPFFPLDDGWISDLELQFAGPSPSEPVFDLKENAATQWADEFDDRTGAQLPGELVRAGKMEETRWVKEIGRSAEQKQSAEA